MMMTPDLNDDSNQASTTLTQPPVNNLKRKNFDTDDNDTNDEDNHKINISTLISTSLKTGTNNSKSVKSKSLVEQNL